MSAVHDSASILDKGVCWSALIAGMTPLMEFLLDVDTASTGSDLTFLMCLCQILRAACLLTVVLAYGTISASLLVECSIAGSSVGVTVAGFLMVSMILMVSLGF